MGSDGRVSPVPRFVSLFMGVELNGTVLNCSCHALLWGYLSV